MCKCRLCWCWYINICHSCVGCGNFYGCCGYNCFDPLTNLVAPTCNIFCCSCFCCKYLGWGNTGICCSSIYGASPDFDNEDAEARLNELGSVLKKQRMQENAAAALAANAMQAQTLSVPRPTSSVYSAGDGF